MDCGTCSGDDLCAGGMCKSYYSYCDVDNLVFNVNPSNETQSVGCNGFEKDILTIWYLEY